MRSYWGAACTCIVGHVKMGLVLDEGVPSAESSSYQRAQNRSEKHIRNTSKMNGLQNGTSSPERAQEDETHDHDT